MKIRAAICLALYGLLAGLIPSGAVGVPAAPGVEEAAGDGVEEKFFTAYPDLRNEREVVSKAARALAAEGQQSEDWRLAAEVLANRTRALLAERTPVEWQRKAVSLYPQLGVEGSAFNKLFLQHYREMQSTSPAFAEEPSWPVLLAERCAEELRPKTKPASGAKASLPPTVAVSPNPQPPRARAGFWQSTITVILLLVVLALPARFLLRKSVAHHSADPVAPAHPPLAPPWRHALKPTACAYAVAALAGMIRTLIVNADQSFIDRFGITLLVSLLLGVVVALPAFGCATLFYSFQQYRGTASNGSGDERPAEAKIGG